MRRGAATDLMDQVGDALTAPRVASMADERPPCWWIEKGVRTKKAGQSGQGCETGSTKVWLPPKTMPCLDHTRPEGVVFVGSHTLE